MTDPDPRPRPQFGEYATPEEQRASIKIPHDAAHPEPVPVPASRVVHPPAGQHPTNLPHRAPDSSRSASGPRPGDRIATIALLGIGLINVITTVPGLFSLSKTLGTTFEQMGVGHFTPTPLADGLGIALAVFYMVAWLVTLGLSLRSLRRDRVSFWIPLVAGVVVTIVAMICFLVVFFSDPAFMDYVTRSAT